MGQRILAKIIGASLALAVASCATLEREEVAAPAMGGDVAMRADAALVVNLPVEPTPGAGWHLRSASPNLALIGGPDVTPAPKPPGLVGVADTATFRFRAKAPGDGALEFVARASPGQAATAPERVVRYAVVVGPPLRLPTDYFGTLGMQSARSAGNSTMGAPVASAGTQGSPAADNAGAPGTPPPPNAGSGSGGAPSAVKYWAH